MLPNDSSSEDEPFNNFDFDADPDFDPNNANGTPNNIGRFFSM